MIEEKTVELIRDIANHLMDGHKSVITKSYVDNFQTNYVLQAALVYVKAEKLARRKLKSKSM